MDGITVTERAARRIGEILRHEPRGTMLRLSVEGGGCSGFQYKFGTDSAQEADDIVVRRQDALLLIDPVSLGYLAVLRQKDEPEERDRDERHGVQHDRRGHSRVNGRAKKGRHR